MQRTPTKEEIEFINKFSKNIDEFQKIQFINDLSNSTIDLIKEKSGWIYKFYINGYERPPYKGQHAFNTEGEISDIDGGKINAYIYADENNRLLEIELIRGEDGNNIISPQFETFNLIY